MANTETFSAYSLQKDLFTGEVAVYSTISKKILNPKVNKNGYRQVTVINDEGQRRTMNYARFLLILTQPQEDYTGLCVDHINRDKTDDNLKNLRWVTAKENQHNRINGKRPHRNEDIVIIYDNGTKFYYTKQTRTMIDIPYTTLYTLAVAKEGSHHSKKHGITCYYKNDYRKLGGKLL